MINKFIQSSLLGNELSNEDQGAEFFSRSQLINL